jgi:membrane dipeptidase
MALPSADPRQLAASQGVSLEAAELMCESDVIDLHIDTFIPPRLPLVRYDLMKQHDRVLLGGRFFGHLDIPRVLASGLSGAMWSITTNPFRRASRRWVLFQRNLERLRAMVASTEGRFEIATSASEYRAARARGAHVVLVSIQGGNALEAAPGWLDAVPDSPVVRVTLVHLTNAAYGITSSPLRLWKGKQGLTEDGRAFVRHLNEKRVFCDLAHINARGFWDAVEVHDKSLPLIATHTGVTGVKPHWRNLDDAQVRAIADSGGVVGIIFAQNFLRPRGGENDVGIVVAHMEHVMKVGGAQAVALGTDYDGAIIPPRDLRSGMAYVRLVQRLLDRGHPKDRIRGFLGGNFLRSFERLRP